MLLQTAIALTSGLKKKYAIEPPKHLPELPVEFLEMQRKFYKRAIKEILEEVSQALRRGKDTHKKADIGEDPSERAAK